jgi:hypothetical protein
MLSSPGVDVRKGGGYIDTYYRGTDNGIVARSWVPGSGWTAPDTTTLAAGKTLNAPALASRNPEVLDIYVRGTDDQLYGIEWNGSAWGSWTLQPGGMTTQRAPAVTTRGASLLDLFARGADGEIRWQSFDGASWSAWKGVPGQVDSGPAVVADSPDRLYLFARRGDDVIWNLYDRGMGAQEGWRGWRLLHPPPPTPPPPGCDPNAGRLTGHAHPVAFGKRPVVSGRVRRTDGPALPDSTVTVSFGSWARTGVSNATGHYKVRIPRGPTRVLRLQAVAPGASALVCATARVRTRAGVRLKASERVRPAGRVRFRGRLLGKPIPRRGKLIELQAFDGGRWRVFASPRTGRKGHFKTSYRLRRTFAPRTFRFRARVRKESGYPYELGYSRSVKVRVR